MTTTSHEELHADAFPVGRRLMYLDHDADGPDKVTVRVGVVTGECRVEPDSALLILVADSEDDPEPAHLIASTDVLGSGSRAANQHEADRPPRWRHHLSREGRHHRQENPVE